MDTTPTLLKPLSELPLLTPPQVREVKHPAGGVLRVDLTDALHEQAVIMFTPQFEGLRGRRGPLSRRELMTNINAMTHWELQKAKDNCAPGTKWVFGYELVNALMGQAFEDVSLQASRMMLNEGLSKAGDTAKALVATIEYVKSLSK